LFINAFATFRLPLEMQQSSPLVPALQSNWLMMHVTVMILSYSALICGSLLSIAFLIVTKNFQFDLNTEKKSLRTPIPFIEGEGVKNNQVPSIVSQTSFSTQNSDILSDQTFAFSSDSQTVHNGISMGKSIHNSDWGESSKTKQFPIVNKSESSFEKTLEIGSPLQMKKNFAENLDNLSYRILGIGFPLLTIGILSGAVWANEAWGSYWSWDPKETWALATWFVFAIYLHLRISKGWRGKKPAVLASIGFLTVWICFLGVNLLGEGLHSYGFLKESL
jgi:cytochrome c-type biogenesis protein CcsB